MRRVLACCLALALSTTGCGATADSGTLEITVMGLPAPTDAAGRKWFTAKIAAFEAANPGIRVKPSEATFWDARSFAARLAAGNVETVIRVPLTEPAQLIARGQVADITAEARALPGWSAFDPKVLEPVTKGGKVFGIPENMYALGISYNRSLFAKAGLDPDRPPSTWDELRAAARQVKERTGAIGFGATTTKNAGGWHLSAATYAYGGTMERLDASTATAAFTDGPTEQFLKLLKEMRWTDGSMGGQQLRSQDDMNRDFATGRIAMAINAPDYYPVYAQNYRGDPEAFGMAALPQHGGDATLVGGTVDMVSAKASTEQRAAAVKWIDFSYLKVASDPAAAAEFARSRAADGLAVGVPVLPLFDQSTSDKVNAAIAPHVNLPAEHFQPFLDGTRRLRYLAEPPVAAQELYAVLDSTLQAVLTKPDADPHTLLAEAADRVNAILRQQP
jgi:ABC-type glycerol-3-phosphate transport system substrate-binding protein